MKKWFYLLLTLLTLTLLTSAFAIKQPPLIDKTYQSNLTPDQALQLLKQGNARFMSHQRLQKDLIKKATLSAKGQYPAALVLGCIDSRVPPEIVFDQNVGNIFVSRVAANVINKDVLGGMEFATKVAGAKLIVILGHDACGAVKGACQNVKLGNLTHLLAQVQPAIEKTTKAFGKKECNREKFIDAAAANNVRNVVKAIPKRSKVIRQLIAQGKIKLVGAMYDLNTGKVTFLNS